MKTNSEDTARTHRHAPSQLHFRAQRNVLNPKHGEGHAGTATPLFPHQVGTYDHRREGRVGRRDEQSRGGAVAIGQLVPL